ncbi:MAG: FimB/Mfa2 family fimbrial subunit, partial [Candidatus Homeothermus sp.]|nr:FimB/Mfa2 family fimbrial subunit [Candidatus Homeothermus sp.]
MLKTLSAIAAALALAGCIRDNRDDCLFPLRLHFTYLYNVEDTDLFSDEVETLCLYLYDTET